MADNRVFKFKGIQGAEQEISPGEIMNMPMPEFLVFQNRLMDVRRRKRRDIAIFVNNVAVTPAHEKQIFRRGVGEVDTYANANTEYVKTRAQTNMSRGGHFGEGNMTIICGIEAYFNLSALQATTTQHGVITNPLGVVLAAYDPFMVAQAWCSQTEIGFYRNERLIVDGLVEEFPQRNGLSGVAGASVGAMVQNTFLPSNQLAAPEVLIDDEDFYILVTPLAPTFDLTGATGLNIGLVQEVKLETIELVRNR